MKRTELKRGKPLERKTPLGHRGTGLRVAEGTQRRTRSTLKAGRGFAASKAQREKVRGMACAFCGEMADEYLAIDPAHVCARGMGGCDEPECVIPLCRGQLSGVGCHRLFDEGLLDLIAKLEPAFRAEVAHAVMHLGLEGARVRLAPSQYRHGRGVAA